MSQPYLGELKLVSFNFAPRNWVMCNGQLMAINQNQALFSLLGTTYGGDGRITFALPNLQGRTPVSTGQGITLGQTAGEASHTLTVSEFPAHTHLVQAAGTANTPAVSGNLPGGQGVAAFASASNLVAMNQATLSPAGSSQPHNNLQPYLVMNWIIALQGIFPSRN